jgi:uncharacterized protein (TIGR02466 family)
MSQQHNRQPSQSLIQSLVEMVQAGQFEQTEATAKMLLNQYPEAFVIYNILGVAQEHLQKFADAATTYREALKIDPRVAEVNFNLGAVLGHLGQHDEAIAYYRRALSIKPNLDAAWFNLGFALQEKGEFEEAAASYRKAIALVPDFFEAYGNLGVVLQKQGKLEDAIANYRKALAINPDALGHFNLGTALRDEGKHEEAGQCYLKALELNPNYADAHNNLGEIFRDQGNMDAAIKSYQTALAIIPDHPGANYNMGEFLYLAKKYEEARPYFERSKFLDFEERALDCLYRTEQYDAFKAKLDVLVKSGKKSTLLSMLSNHYSSNFAVPDEYNFCTDPMKFAWHTNIPELAEPGSPLLNDLLEDITHTALAERKQGRLYYGMQSAGNLLKRPEPSFQKLATLVKSKILEYKARYADSDCELIKSFPKEIEFSSSWYLRMTQGGHLTSHIHEEGWISGCVYLKLPTVRKDPTEAAFEYGTDGDDYPRKHDNFPSQIVVQKVGDIVLFPSSLFHRTIPFKSDEDRVCVAFDLKPAA